MAVKNERSAKGYGKKATAAKALVDHNKVYELNEAISLVKSASFAKFDETVEVALMLGVDPKRSDQVVRGMVSMPRGTGKKLIVGVICKEDKAQDAKAAGADIVGGVELIDEIKKGVINFDRLIATPDMMGLLGAVAKILGPKGLMPNPKLGTVTLNVAEAVKNAKAGQVEFRAEKGGIVHAGVGKVSFVADSLQENICALVEAVVRAKPSGAKGSYIKKLYLSSTMGPGVQVNIGHEGFVKTTAA